jgi:ribulose-phosphate 3-epimerase
VAINPATPIGALADAASMIDMALCMTVNPGWGGQRFIARSPEKVRALRALVGDSVAVEVDGGIDTLTAPACRASGANVFVAGAAVFGAPDPGAAYQAIVAALDS